MNEDNIKTGKVIPYFQALPDFMRYRIISGFILLLLAKVLGYAFELLLKSAGKVAITSSDILFLISSIQGILLLIVAFILVVLYCVIELNGLIIMSDKFMKAKQIKVFEIVREALLACKKFYNPKSIILVIYIAVLAPIVGVGISISLTQYFYIPTFISSVINDTPVYQIIFLVVLLILFLMYFFYCFTMHGVILDDLSFNDAMKNSRILICKNWKNYIWQHIHFEMVQILTLGPLSLFLLVSPLAIYASGMSLEKTRFYTIFILILGAIFMLTVTFYATPFYILKLTRLYRSYQCDTQIYYPIRKFKMPTILIVGIIFSILISALAGYVGSELFDEIFDHSHVVEVIAHRGGGNEGVENTISGLNTAYSLKAFGSEIDVQRTKDDHYIINHDTNFLRIAGVDKRPSEMTLEEIKQLNINGEKVPTMEEMLDASHDKLILFIELKGESADNRMADDVIKMVKERSMQDEVVLISLKYDLIDYIEDNYPDIQTAYLTFISFGDIAGLNCDYIGLEEESATYQNINRIHENNKKVLVWTVNSEESQKHFLLTEVDGIITDNVKQANTIRDQLKQRDDLIRLYDFILDLLR